MILSVSVNNHLYKIDAKNPFELSIPLNFNGEQPNAFDVEPATAKPCEVGSFFGDTRRGGSCNFEEYTFIPHCNGTHTECVGHITDERISVHDCLKDSLIAATLISVSPENSNTSSDNYPVKLNERDELITEKVLREKLDKADFDWLDALIVRTLPNDKSKKTLRYTQNSPPFFSTEAINYISQIGVKHLLVDLPSIDRTFDEGKLSNHRAFWKVAPESKVIEPESLVNNTITEMIYVSNEISDGAYLLNLQIAAFNADAAPSRPRLFRIIDQNL